MMRWPGRKWPYATLGVLVYLLAWPHVGKLVPAAWWLNVRDVRVSSGVLGVAIDRDIGALWGDPVKLVDGSGRESETVDEPDGLLLR